MSVAGVVADVESRRDEMVALCARLVAAPSVNPPGDTRAAADVVSAALEADGLTQRRLSAEPSMPNVIASVDSGRPGRHLIFNGHLDTMPPGDEALWSVPRYELTRSDGRLYGLGMGNMKGAVAAMCFALSLLDRSREQWCGRVSLVAVSDEVVFGGNGTAHLLDTDAALRGDAVLSGEGPGFRRLAVGEKGVCWLRLTATSPGGHSSGARRGQSAIAQLAEAVVRLDALSGQQVRPPPDLQTAAGAGPDDMSSALTVNVGTIEGGTFIGQVPVRAEAAADLRLPPGMSAADAEQRVRDVLVDLTGITVERLKGWDPNWTSPAGPLATCFTAAHVALRAQPPVTAVRLPASDASRWRALGVPALCYGPQPGLSAGIDDYAEEQEVLDCVSLYVLTALAYLGDDGCQPMYDPGGVR